jgi:hypothetical protein
MNGISRRNFLVKALKGAGLAVLAAVPGSFFSKRNLFAQAETFENILSRTTSSNVIGVLNGSRLSPVDKLAILAVRKIPTGEIRTAISQWDSLADKAKRSSEGGFFCGGDCGDKSGFICGSGCRAPQGSSFVLDKAGDLNVDFPHLDKTACKTALQKAVNLVR